MLTHKMNQIAIKTGFDVAHLAITILLATTSWAALFGGLAEKFTFVGAAVLMLLVNIAFDFFPFILGCYVSGELGREQEDDEYLASENLWVVAVVAMVLHIGSGVITYSGANLAASLFSNGEAIAEQIGGEEQRIQAENATAVLEYNKAVSNFEALKAERLKGLAENHNASIARLQAERQAMQEQNYPKNAAIVAQKIAALEKGYQKSVAEIQAETPKVVEPHLQSPGGYAKGLQQRFEEDQKAKNKIAFALRFTDISSLVIMALWFQVLFMVPGIAGNSNLVIWMFGWAFTLAAKVSQKALAYEKLLQANSDDQLYALAAIEENAIRRLQEVEKSYQEQLAEKEEALLRSFQNRASEMSAQFVEEKKSWVQKMERQKTEWEAEKSEWEKRVAQEQAEWASEKAEWERQKSEWEAEKSEWASGEAPVFSRRVARVEKASGKASEKASEKASGEWKKRVEGESVRERKRAIRDDEVIFEGKIYKDLKSFAGSMRSAKSAGRNEVYLKMKAHYNSLLGIESTIKKIS